MNIIGPSCRTSVTAISNCDVRMVRRRPFWSVIVPGMRGVAIGSLALALAGPVAAQQERAVSSEKRSNSLTEGIRHLAAGNLDAAEPALFKYNFHQPNTLAWRIESAQKLSYAAQVLQQQNAYERASQAASRALALLVEAESKPFADAIPETRARMHEMAGWIYEKVLFAPAAAKESFLKAQREFPASRGAKAGLRRIEEAEAISLRATGRKD